MGKVMMLALLVLTACGEGGGDDGAGGAGGNGILPDEAPRCVAPQVQPCPEGENYYTRESGGWAMESCAPNPQGTSSVIVGRRNGVLATYSVGRTTTGCWPDGSAQSVTVFAEDGTASQRCWDDDESEVSCEDQSVAARYNAAWGL